MKKTKTIEVWACDGCGAEQSHVFETCDKCKVEICLKCQTSYEAKVIRWSNDVGQGFVLSSSLQENGLRQRLCKPCGAELEKVFRDAGFKDFSTEIIPV